VIQIASDGSRVELQERADVLEGEQRPAVGALHPLLCLPAEQAGLEVLRIAASLDAVNGVLENGQGEAQLAVVTGLNSEQMEEMALLQERGIVALVEEEIDTTSHSHGVPPR
jgi:hypothetical protein